MKVMCFFIHCIFNTNVYLTSLSLHYVHMTMKGTCTEDLKRFCSTIPVNCLMEHKCKFVFNLFSYLSIMPQCGMTKVSLKIDNQFMLSVISRFCEFI